MKVTAGLLQETADFLLGPTGWCKGAEARDRSGVPCDPYSPHAVAFSVEAALVVTADDLSQREDLPLAILALRRVVGYETLSRANDARTYPEIEAWLQQAILQAAGTPVATCTLLDHLLDLEALLTPQRLLMPRGRKNSPVRAADGRGDPVDPTSPVAVAWTLEGAIAAVCGPDHLRAAVIYQHLDEVRTLGRGGPCGPSRMYLDDYHLRQGSAVVPRLLRTAIAQERDNPRAQRVKKKAG